MNSSKPSEPRRAAARRAKRMPGSERRLQLLAAAREIILRDGIGAMNMSALAVEVGVAKPIVYKHFHNREDVAIALLREYERGSVRASAPRLQSIETVFEFYDTIVECMFDYIAGNGAIVRSITNGFSTSARVDAAFLASQARALRVNREILAQQGVPDVKAEVAAYMLMEMINAPIHEFAGRGCPKDREVIKELVGSVVRALVPGSGVKPNIGALVFAIERDVA